MRVNQVPSTLRVTVSINLCRLCNYLKNAREDLHTRPTSVVSLRVYQRYPTITTTTTTKKGKERRRRERRQADASNIGVMFGQFEDRESADVRARNISLQRKLMVDFIRFHHHRRRLKFQYSFIIHFLYSPCQR